MIPGSTSVQIPSGEIVEVWFARDSDWFNASDGHTYKVTEWADPNDPRGVAKAVSIGRWDGADDSV